LSDRVDCLPNDVFILGVGFSLDIVHDLPDKQYGDSHSGKRIIRLSNDQDLLAMQDTVIHELAHCILNLGGLAHVLGDAQEEAVCYAIGHGLSQILRDNPEIGAFLARTA
jgi:hypothetical protein